MPFQAFPEPVRFVDAVRPKVLSLVASVYDVPVAELAQSTRQGPKVAAARQVAIYLAHTVLKLSFTDLAALFGRSRSTALHAVRRVEERREDPRVDQTLTWLESLLRSSMEIVQ
jgi:chromosomal replication initiation ATPase DnaA